MADEVDYESDAAMGEDERPSRSGRVVRREDPGSGSGSGAGRRVVKGRGRGAAAMDADRYPDESGVFEKLRAGGRDDAGALQSVEGWLLFVRGVHEEAQEEDVMDAFSEDAPVKDLHMNLDRRTGFVKGYALVEFGSFEDARDAKERLDGQEILGKTIHVDWAFRKEPSEDDRRGGRRNRNSGRR